MKLSTGLYQRHTHLSTLIQQRLGIGLVQSRGRIGEKEWLVVKPQHLIDVLAFMKNDPDATQNMLLDIFCIDHLLGDQGFRRSSTTPERFEVSYQTRSHRLTYQAWLSVFVPENQLHLPSASSIFLNAVRPEEELWDLFGIFIEGHPHLRRPLLYPGFSGHPMRKDYPKNKPQPLVPMLNTRKTKNGPLS